MKNLFRIPAYLILILTLVAALSCSSVGLADEKVELKRKFTGKIAEASLQNAAPISGVINDLGTWQKLWVSWRPDQAIETVDFENELVLVVTARGPSTVFTSRLIKNDTGGLNFEVASSASEGPGFGYLIMVIPKTGIQTVNGKSANGKLVVEQSQPALASNQAPPEVVDPRPIGESSVAVEIVGSVKINLRSAGPTNTGNLIAADNIIWELDFQDNLALMQAARAVGDSLARIKGKLSRLRGDGLRYRWIVAVESIEILNLRLAPDDLPSVAAQPNPAQPQTPIAPIQTTPTMRPNPDLVTSPNSDGNLNAQDPAALQAFEQIKIKTSDGRIQTFSKNGVAKFESTANQQQNIEWTIGQKTLWDLHNLVARTRWQDVPKINRAPDSDQNTPGFSITVESRTRVTRIFVDASEVPKIPAIKRLFELVSQAAQEKQ
ncbi:MAG: hypothetical protein ACI814_001077 [Mariniblastus sp.]|jgi:hypothetical protein